MTKKKVIGIIAGIVVAVVLAFIPAPAGLDANAMRFIGLFAAFLIWMVAGAAPEHICGLVALSLIVITGTVPLSSALSSFAGTTVWLIIAGFGLAAALTKCGLLKRVAFFVMQFFPESYKGQVAAMLTSGLAVSPLLPSVTAKSVLMSPLSTQVGSALGFKPHSKGMAGIWSATFMSAGILGSAFFTGSLWVFVMLGFMSAEDVAKWNFMSWLSVTFIWLIVMFVLTFFAVVFLFKPEEELDMPKGFIKQQLKDLGPMSKDEKITGIILIGAIIGWMTQSLHGFDASIIAILALGLIGVFTDFTGQDFRTKIPWETAILVGCIVSIANMVTLLGVDVWLGTVLGPVLSPLLSNPFIMVILLCIVTYVLRLFIISMTATITIVFAIFGVVATSLGIDSFALLFVVATAIQVWHLPFNNTTCIGALAAAGDGLIAYKDISKSSYAYMAINLVALLASVPLWMAFGLV